MQIGALISELNELLADVTTDVQSHDAVMTRLSSANLGVFEFLPASTRQQLLLDRDPHGNVQVGPPLPSRQPSAMKLGAHLKSRPVTPCLGPGYESLHTHIKCSSICLLVPQLSYHSIEGKLHLIDGHIRDVPAWNTCV